MILHLVRHGRAEGADGRCIGHTDLALGEAGAREIDALAAAWPNALRDARIVASDLARARASAGRLAAAWGRDAAEIASDARLREMDFGRWDGRTWAELEAEDGAALGAWMADWARARAADGEGFPDLARRCAAWLDEARASAGRDAVLVVVAHAGSIRALVCHALGLPLDRAFMLRVDHARVSTLRLGSRGAELALLNAASPA